MVATKRDGLLLQSVHDEILIFNPSRNEATALNRSAAVVFDLCDGTNTVESIRKALDDAGLGPSSDDAVWLALTELADADLIVLAGPPAAHLGRRELLKKLGVGAAAAAAILPVVETIAAPSAAAQGSPGSTTLAPTVAPTTMAPSTMAPPTQAPTPKPTPPPSTMAPSTMAPSTLAPSTLAPSTLAPTPAPGTMPPTVAPGTMPLTPAPGTVAPPTPSPTPKPTPAPVAQTPAPTSI